MRGVNLEVKKSEVLGLLGRNGMGKSTLLKSIMGIVPPKLEKGKIYFKKRDLTALEAHQIARQGIGYVPEERRIFPQLSVLENLSVGLDVLGKSAGEKKTALAEIYSHFPGLAERTHQAGESLSGGEQQMLAIARAMLMKPDLILMDEPTEGVMPLLVKEIEQIIQVQKSQGISILLVEQSAITALNVSDRVCVMEKGVIAFEGTTEELKANETIVKELLGV